jgi:hypothetical protein
MTRRTLLALSIFAVACGPAARATGPTIAAIGGPRSVRAITDLEEARDLATVGGSKLVATDDGLWIYANDTDPPTRLGFDEGMPSEDVTSIAIDGDAALVGTGGGLVSVRGTTVTPAAGVPASGRIMDVAVMPDGTAWVCTLSGLLRRSHDAWEVFGDPVACTTLAPTPEGQLWVGTTTGLWYVEHDEEGDIVREHSAASGIPEAYVRAIVPVLPGQILALLSSTNSTRLGFFDGHRWYGYTLPAAGEERVVGLVSNEGVTMLVTNEHVFVVAPNGGGQSFSATDASDSNARSFRPTITPAAQASAPADVSVSETVRAPSGFTQPRTAPPSAPGLVARAYDLGGATRLYRGLQDGDQAYVGIANEGVMAIARGGGSRLQSRSLVSAEDLQVATDTSGAPWVRGRDGDVAKMVDGRLRRLALPREIAPQAVASGPEGAYMVAIVLNEQHQPTNVVRVYTSTQTGFHQLLERTLTVPTSLVAVPFAGVGTDGKVWLGLRIAREEGEGSRMWGAAVLDPASETIAYHHRDAAQGTGLSIPDEVSTMAFDAAGNAWFATLSGAVRVEPFQAITFGEARGVRGDVVTDVVAGTNVMWIAAAEGLGSYADREFDFFQPPIVSQHRPTALAADRDGHVWAAGRYGLLQHDGTEWAHFDHTSGLPTDDLRDVEVDGQGHVWLLTESALLVLEPAR